METKKLSIIQYYKYRLSNDGLRHLMSLTDSHYPRFLSLGYYDPNIPEIVVCTVLNWQLRLKHEQGHADGLKHVPIWKVGYVMHPFGLLRGELY
jgi:hypothetical protein